MKRQANLFPRLHDFGHLYRAYRRALKGSGYTPEAVAFTFHLERELLALSEALRCGTYTPEPYRYFEIYEPKKRLISVAPFRDRVVHHAVVALLEPVFDPAFIYDSYATRKDKGTHAALTRAQHFTRRYRWFFKADVAQYFDSIDHEILIARLAHKVKDPAFLAVTSRIIRNGGVEGKGLPIGNLTSQFFANVYLDPFDQWVKQDLRIKGYLRYMDDFVLFADEKAPLKSLRPAIEAWLGTHLALRLKPKACLLNQRPHGLGFLGARIFPECVRLQYPNRMRLRRRLMARYQAYRDGLLDEDTYTAVLNSYFAHLDHFDVQPFRRQLVDILG